MTPMLSIAHMTSKRGLMTAPSSIAAMLVASTTAIIFTTTFVTLTEGFK